MRLLSILSFNMPYARKVLLASIEALNLDREFPAVLAVLVVLHAKRRGIVNVLDGVFKAILWHKRKSQCRVEVAPTQ